RARPPSAIHPFPTRRSSDLAVCIFSVVAGTAAEAPGFLEGHLKIISPNEVELADANAPEITAERYAQYPLIILSEGGKKEITRVDRKSTRLNSSHERISYAV